MPSHRSSPVTLHSRRTKRDSGTRGPVGHLAQAIEIARSTFVIAGRRGEARQRIERARPCLELDEASQVADGVGYVTELRLRDVCGAPVEICRELRLACRLGELRLTCEERLQLGVLAFAREERRELLHGRFVTRRLPEVLLERGDGLVQLTELVFEACHLEPEREPRIRTSSSVFISSARWTG